MYNQLTPAALSVLRHTSRFNSHMNSTGSTLNDTKNSKRAAAASASAATKRTRSFSKHDLRRLDPLLILSHPSPCDSHKATRSHSDVRKSSEHFTPDSDSIASASKPSPHQLQCRVPVSDTASGHLPCCLSMRSMHLDLRDTPCQLVVGMQMLVIC